MAIASRLARAARSPLPMPSDSANSLRLRDGHRTLLASPDTFSPLRFFSAEPYATSNTGRAARCTTHSSPRGVTAVFSSAVPTHADTMRGNTSLSASDARTVSATEADSPSPLTAISPATILCLSSSVAIASCPSSPKHTFSPHSLASESSTSDTPANCSDISRLVSFTSPDSSMRLRYASAALDTTDARLYIFAQRLVTNGGISSIVTFPLVIAASAMGRMTADVSPPSDEKQASLS